MMKLSLFRTATGDQGTFGVITTPGGITLRTLELPWRENRPNISCVPVGVYEVRWVYSPKFRWCYQVMDVPGRTHIKMHSANYAGDVSKGYRTHLLGCIALGRYTGTLGGQRAVLSSRFAVSDFTRELQGKPFTLTIKELYR